MSSPKSQTQTPPDSETPLHAVAGHHAAKHLRRAVVHVRVRLLTTNRREIELHVGISAAHAGERNRANGLAGHVVQAANGRGLHKRAKA